VLAKRSLTDGYTIAIAVLTAFILWRSKKIPEPLIIAAAAAVGLLVKTIS
jgi:chromate transporter